jgi:hypothetical protein
VGALLSSTIGGDSENTERKIVFQQSQVIPERSPNRVWNRPSEEIFLILRPLEVGLHMPPAHAAEPG